jgi:hypothetical protein
LPTADRAREVWRGLLLAVALLFPLDVALRRVMLGPRDLQKGWNWVRERLPLQRAPGAGQGQRALGRLFEARRRGRERTERVRPAIQDAVQDPKGFETTQRRTAPDAREAGEPPSADKGTNEDPMARLRKAKQRARRGR